MSDSVTDKTAHGIDGHLLNVSEEINVILQVARQFTIRLNTANLFRARLHKAFAVREVSTFVHESRTRLTKHP